MIPYAFKSLRNARHQPGAALIITLSMLMLVAFVVVAFLARTSREAVLVNSAVGGQKADILANSVAELIVADLKSEMRAGSKETTNSGITILQPASAITALPSRSLLSAVSGAPFDNLLKQSGASGGMFSTTAPWNQTNVTQLIPTATSSATIKPSFDGRMVSASRWDKPQLLVGGNFSDTQVPNWVLLNRLGVSASQSWNNNLRDRTPTNDNFAIGRFAYNIYDVSGLLDVNVAGSPTGLGSAEIGRKGSLGLAALAEIPGIDSPANADLFVREWRNKLTAATPEDFLSYHGFGKTTNPYYNFGPTNGFQKTATSGSDSDNRLLSRQDLIKLAANGKFGIATAALPYLTTFTRATNAPAWAPTTTSGSSIDYAAQADTPAAANRFLPNVRVTTSFTRADGTKPESGEPLLKTRFPLSRLAGLGRSGVNTTGNTTLLNGIPSPATAATIQRDFGLVWQTDRWIYAGPSGASVQDSIATLGSISGREPNFFELLQASILSGSLGKGLGDTQIKTLAFDEYKFNQIIQIGVNIIDQYDTDSFPTKITFGTNDFAGIENIPYLTRVFSQFYRLTSDPNNNRGYYMAEVWNPHRPKTNTNGPTRFRFAADGRSRMYVGSVEDPTKPYPNNPNPALNGPSVFPNGQKSVMGFQHKITDSGTPEIVSGAANENFLWPTLLIPAKGASASGNNNVSDGPVKFVGIYTAKIASKGIVEGTGSWAGNGPCYGGYLAGSTNESFYLQYYDGSKWVTYQAWNGHIWSGLWDGGGNRGPGHALSPALYTGGADPRSNRFGIFGNYSHFRSIATPLWNDQNYQDSLYKTLRPDSTQTQDTVWASLPYGVPLYVAAPAPPAGWGPNPLAPGPDGPPAYRMGWLTENKETLPTWYRDPDNILRNGDAAYASGAWGQPLEQEDAAKGLASRPVMLDRPFRSVAEMGYAFRDLPYKSLDFFTTNSGDAALLDIFCLNESPISAVTAGVFNPNTRLQPVLKAVLAGALKDELDAASGLASASEATAIATAITTATATTPLMNRGEIATRITPALTAGSFSNNPADAAIKARRESVVRALADVSNTRTWNLMVDLIVQSGRYPAGASNVDQFSVDGERRYWLHLAIDRHTGRVVARSMESVNE
jgi:hypothetical protein